MTAETPAYPSPADAMFRELDRLCEVMHDAYEREADRVGWATNPTSRRPWADVPESNKASMRAAVVALLSDLNAIGRLCAGPDPEVPS